MLPPSDSHRAPVARTMIDVGVVVITADRPEWLVSFVGEQQPIRVVGIARTEIQPTSHPTRVRNRLASTSAGCVGSNTTIVIVRIEYPSKTQLAKVVQALDALRLGFGFR